MLNLKKISLLLSTIFVQSVNIISTDIYNIDINFDIKNSAPKISDFVEKYYTQHIKLFQKNCDNIYLGNNSSAILEYLIKNKDKNIWGNRYKTNLHIKSCFIDQELAGFILYLNEYFDPTCNEKYTFGDKSHLQKVGHIALLCVNKNYRQQNIGTKLIALVLTELFDKEKVEFINVLTTDDNFQAKSLYEKLGFRKINTDKSTNIVSYKLENSHSFNTNKDLKHQ